MNKELRNELESLTPRSAWDKGIKDYALDLVEKTDNTMVELTHDNALYELLNGAENWSEYSWGGNACIYDADIVEMLCTPSEIKRFENGRLNKPNANEEWLDTQARALKQAYQLIESKL